MVHRTVKWLEKLNSPRELRQLSYSDLDELAADMRAVLCSIVSDRTAHFASNLGVVELAIALHRTYDFSRDRLIWDTGHQIYPHKLLTGRFADITSIRTKGGLMGYPNPAESDYDLFMTGHAGCSVSTALGLKSGDDLMPGQDDRHSVAVIGDGAFPSGIVFEAMNNASGLKKNLLMILNDNGMSICPRVGGVAHYLDKFRVGNFYTGLKDGAIKLLDNIPLVGEGMKRSLATMKDSVKAGLHGGMLFEEMGFRYIGPIDGHDLKQLCEYLELVKDLQGPVLLHVFTEKGHGFQPAAADPVLFHTPAPFTVEAEGQFVFKKSSSRAYTDIAAETIFNALVANPKVTVLTAAMCQGNKLERVRQEFPDRFFDTGICESHAVAFAAGQAKAGLRPIVDIYSTFLQRSYDQIFQEVALQSLPVTFLLDRAGLTGADGPTHHGAFDIGYMRVFPNMVVMAPGDEADLPAMIDFALQHDAPVSIRYPKANVERLERALSPVQLGQAEVLEWGHDGMIVAFGSLLPDCLRAAERLRADGLDVGVINARFVKPLDTETLFRAIESCRFVVTVEEGCLMGGFGSAVLEAANEAGLATQHVRRLGLPDRFVEHGERPELLADLSLDADGIAATCRELAEGVAPRPRRRVS
jgi:1-deoxy-D-xylulose-5-phosphate synthase